MNNLEAAATTFSHLPGMIANDPGQEGSTRVAFGMLEAANVLGYIPGVSVIVGIARIIFAAFSAKGSPELAGMQCLRGTFEMLCLGPLMILSDAITSIWLACMKPSTNC